MCLSLIADYSFNKLTDISPHFLKERGKSLLLLDLDNTIVSYDQSRLTDEVLRWAKDMMEKGITLFIVSNNRKAERVISFADKLGTGYIKGAGKPSTKGIREAIRICGKKPEETALAGDQSFTDVLGTKRAGATALLIEPISLKNPLLALRYFLELPWRAACKERVI